MPHAFPFDSLFGTGLNDFHVAAVATETEFDDPTIAAWFAARVGRPSFREAIVRGERRVDFCERRTHADDVIDLGHRKLLSGSVIDSNVSKRSVSAKKAFVPPPFQH